MHAEPDCFKTQLTTHWPSEFSDVALNSLCAFDSLENKAIYILGSLQTLTEQWWYQYFNSNHNKRKKKILLEPIGSMTSIVGQWKIPWFPAEEIWIPRPWKGW